ncbi:hypothetical protein NDU88_001405 [Pleurodeles waltl]|uniref:E3 ubiquitin-protein ligase ZSWIM2 n=1 Tax=Pleurodeles waltl TaxID=8319 RepID=A0AAV7NJY8_PLEWA|nr:hypothetical protein NDU88_001405 [Pleurodeles waltl]
MRQTPWRRGPTDAVSWHLDQAANTTIYILRETGPTGFLLRDEDEAKPFKVLLGDPHTCNCPSFLREKEPCKHICWLLLRRFKLPRDHEYAYQAGLVEREINSILRGLHSPDPATRKSPPPATTGAEEAQGRQKDLDSEDVCPICQDELLRRRLPVTYCRTCGNAVHINCMKIWTEHQPQPEIGCTAKCPLCREDFAPLRLLKEEIRNASQSLTAAEKEKPERHLGIPCNNCMALPIEGLCYKCNECNNFHLCQGCFTAGRHPPHQFLSRLKRNQRWRPLGYVSESPSEHKPCEELEAQLKEEMGNIKGRSSSVPKQVLKSFPLMLVRQSSKLLSPGHQCRICLKAFSLGQYARLLPCRHTFHRDCIDKWLLHEDACPLDKQVLYNPLTWKEVTGNEKLNNPGSVTSSTRLSNTKEAELFVPGTGLFIKQKVHGHVEEMSQINGKSVFHEKDWPDLKHTPSSNVLEFQCSRQSSTKHCRAAGTAGSEPYNCCKELAIDTFKKPCSIKLVDYIVPRKGILPKRIRGASSACGNLINTNKKQNDTDFQGDPEWAATLHNRNTSKSAAALGFDADFNTGVLLGTSNFSLKGEPEAMRTQKGRRRLLSRRPKQIPVSFQSPDVAFLMEGIPLNSPG